MIESTHARTTGKALALPPSKSARCPESVIPLVLAGGSGKRLEHIAELFEGHPIPKQFCRFGRGKSLLQETLARIENVSKETTQLIVNSQHMETALEQLEAFPNTSLIEQPCDKGTAAGVLLGLLSALRANPSAIVVITPSDHAFERPDIFSKSLERAIDAVRRDLCDGVLLAAPANAPRTDFGWIVPGQPLESRSDSDFRTITQFEEKPAQSRAIELMSEGGLWSTMVTVAHGHKLLTRFLERLPILTQTLIDATDSPIKLKEAYLQLTPNDFSRDVIGDGSGLLTLSWENAGWVDLGVPERLLKWLRGQISGAVNELSHGERSRLGPSRDQLGQLIHSESIRA